MASIEALRKKVLEKTKKRLTEALTEKDRYLIQAVETLEDLDNVFNLLVARVREWYSIHFPELNTKLKDHIEFLRFVSEVGFKEKATGEIATLASSSSGSPMREEDYAQIKELADIALRIKKYREELSKYVENEMERLAPNVKALAGPILGAKLIAKAGGLKKLASLPASTIQVLGAEKALFRHLTKGTRPPKHGILFQHPWVRNAKKWQRGKIARTLAAKLAIAAREDYFGGKYIGDELKKEMEERIREIKEKYPEPPKGKKGGRKWRR